MTQQGQYFDATQFSPEQGGGPQHPVGRFKARITHTEIAPTNDKDGSYLAIEYSTPQGKAIQRLNLWNNNAKTVEIAQKQLSAVCYATGVHRLDMNNAGRELQGADVEIEVRQQVKNPNYTEVAMVLDKNGVDPKQLTGAGRSGNAQGNGGYQPPNSGQPQGGQPQGGAPGGGWPSTGAQPFQQPQQQQPQSGFQPPNSGQPNSGQAWQPNSGGTPQGAPWANGQR